MTGITAPYYQFCATCTRPSGLGNITMTNPNYQVYSGVTGTVNKRFSNKWQLNGSVTWQTNPQYTPDGGFADPQGVEFNDGYSTLARYLVKLNGSYALPWGIPGVGELQRAGRRQPARSPSTARATSSAASARRAISRTDARRSERTASMHLEANKLLDLGVQKTFAFSGGRYRAKLMLDAFNVFNTDEDPVATRATTRAVRTSRCRPASSRRA